MIDLLLLYYTIVEQNYQQVIEKIKSSIIIYIIVMTGKNKLDEKQMMEKITP